MSSSFEGSPENEEGISRRDLLKKVSPLGVLTLDKSACTGCGLCALECSTEALTFSAGEEADSFRMLFRHSLCVACGQCVQVCPEKCLKLERTLQVAGLNQPAALLFEDKVVRCVRCGRPVGTRAMLDSIRAKLNDAGQPPASPLELCPECKLSARVAGVGK